MGVGRFFCVALPFALTVGSIIFLLVGSLAGIADKSLYLFHLDVSGLTIDPLSVDNYIENLTSRAAKADNITAADLQLAKTYDVNLWGYCYKDQKNKRHCTKPKFDWANEALNASYIEKFGSAASVKITLPTEIKKALKAFRYVSKWTEVAFIIALISLAVEIVLGLFANCSTIMSCCTWVVAGIASTLVCCAAGLATAMAAIVIGAVEASAKKYGVKGRINTTFLSVVWISAAFAIGASLFWVFTICCCKPTSRSSKKNRRSDGEKLLPSGAYAPIAGDHEMTSGNYYNQNQSTSQYGAPRHQSNAPRSDLAYEPYSHRA